MKMSEINRDDLSKVMQQYYDMKIENKDLYLFFQIGDFYEMFFDDAVEVAQLLELTLTGKKAGLEERIPMCGVPLRSIDTYIEKLVKLDKKVALVSQDEISDLNKKVVNRRLSKIITPGLYTNLNEIDNSYIGAITQEEEFLLSYVDIATGEAFVATFTFLNDAIEEVIKLKMKELVHNFALADNERDYLKYHNVYLTEYQNTKQVNKVQAPTKYREVISLLLNYMTENLQKSEHIDEFVEIEFNKYLQMPSFTQKQLELYETLKDQSYIGSLLHYMNRTKTAMGRRYLKQVITKPLIDQYAINERHNFVEILLKQPLILEELKLILEQIYDFERIIGRISDKTVMPKEIVQLQKSLKLVPNLKVVANKSTEEKLIDFFEDLDEIPDLATLLEEMMLEEPSLGLKEGNLVKSTFHEEIKKYRDLKDNSTDWLLNFENEQKETTGIKNLKVKYNRVFGYFIEIGKSSLENVPDSYTRKQTTANAERYITEELKIAESEILNAADYLINLEYQLFLNLREQLIEYVPRLKKIAKIIAQIDLFQAFAELALKEKLVRPEFTEENEIILTESFHPIVKTGVNNFINNDLNMDEKEQIILITGPNMSGKSTYMRQVAINIIMAQIGSFVCASYMRTKIFDKLYTRIGASDDLALGKSTFMVEMTETSQAIKDATENSLLLFDELGRGTSTYDGIALANGIIKYIIEEVGAKTLFSTHYHELTTLEEEFDVLHNYHVKAKEENDNIQFFHKVEKGWVKKSYGIEVAKLAELPAEILNNAKKTMVELEMKEIGTNKEKTGQRLQQLELEHMTLQEKTKKEEEIITQLKKADLDNLTPLESMQLLNEIKKRLNQ